MKPWWEDDKGWVAAFKREPAGIRLPEYEATVVRHKKQLIVCTDRGDTPLHPGPYDILDSLVEEAIERIGR